MTAVGVERERFHPLHGGQRQRVIQVWKELSTGAEAPLLDRVAPQPLGRDFVDHWAHRVGQVVFSRRHD